MLKGDARRNVVALTADFALFSVGLTFYDPFVILPAYVQALTGSELVVGALSAIRVLMIALPQVWAASFLTARPQKKPLLVWSSIGGRLPILLLAFASLSWAEQAPGRVVAVLGLSVALFFVSEGLNGVSWPALVGKVVPDKIRGRFLGLGQLLSSGGALAAGYVVRIILGDGSEVDMRRWALLFGLSFVGLMLSVAAMLAIRETAEERPRAKVSVRQGTRAIVACLRRNLDLRRVVVTQILVGTAAATFPFFVVRAQQTVAGSDRLLWLYLVMQSVGGAAAAISCGQLIDRVGSWAAIRAVVLAQVLVLAIVSAGGSVSPAPVYLGGFLLLGFVSSSTWWSFSAYLLDMGTEEERPLYLAASGILTAPVFLSSLATGALMEVLRPETVFAAALALSVLGLGLAWGLRRPAAEPVHEGTAGLSL
ncbi:MAG: MFS transporter [Anaerolineae bacterium]